MAYVNEIRLLGNVGIDPEIRYWPDGTPVARFTLATTRVSRDRETGERMEKTVWHRLVAYRKLAETVGKYVQKGDQVLIRGELGVHCWIDDNTKERRERAEIEIDDIQFLTSRADRQ